MELIYHLALASDLDAARRHGEYRMSSVGRTLEEEGFVHASFADQLEGVAQRYYAGVDVPLVLLCVDPALLDAPVRVEGGFPHVYGPLPMGAVRQALPVARRADGSLDVCGLLPDARA